MGTFSFLASLCILVKGIKVSRAPHKLWQDFQVLLNCPSRYGTDHHSADRHPMPKDIAEASGYADTAPWLLRLMCRDLTWYQCGSRQKNTWGNTNTRLPRRNHQGWHQEIINLHRRSDLLAGQDSFYNDKPKELCCHRNLDTYLDIWRRRSSWRSYSSRSAGMWKVVQATPSEKGLSFAGAGESAG